MLVGPPTPPSDIKYIGPPPPSKYFGPAPPASDIIPIRAGVVPVPNVVPVAGGFKKILAYGIAYGVLMAIGYTGAWQLAYAIEGVALLSLLLTSNKGANAIGSIAAVLVPLSVGA